jgi:hypothetical protein
MHQDAPYFIILLCLMPDDLTRQGLMGKSAATNWVNTPGPWTCTGPMLVLCE